MVTLAARSRAWATCLVVLRCRLLSWTSCMWPWLCLDSHASARLQEQRQLQLWL